MDTFQSQIAFQLVIALQENKGGVFHEVLPWIVCIFDKSETLIM